MSLLVKPSVSAEKCETAKSMRDLKSVDFAGILIQDTIVVSAIPATGALRRITHCFVSALSA
jgi:hypothetical protein